MCDKQRFQQVLRQESVQPMSSDATMEHVLNRGWNATENTTVLMDPTNSIAVCITVDIDTSNVL